ncbi:pyridoxamine 5'-phosphate oxidase family protein [Streptomyces hoynatensis]|uniref:PPOX class F420-dependent oxidoreductase n=1 Tax=Streptomyces hoynatensis TaxID=1141874 RepID=A0A3A9Z1M8_9ACTN|nr:pyridoxamine 5'-phosphate oxidase family protein [Streptomyces hoynatensis]RKN41824.1 PPOX class F420-dependent oxidoreductase [Streptomyces hoynatensis]
MTPQPAPRPPAFTPSPEAPPAGREPAPEPARAEPSGDRPRPRVLTEEEASDLLGGQLFGVLSLVRASGRPHLSTVLFRWDPATRLLRIPSVADRFKVRRLRRAPLAALHAAPGPLSYAVAEGEAEISEVTRTPGDAVGRELLAISAAHEAIEDEAAFLAELVAERRVVIRLRVSRLYGTSLEGTAG